MYIFQYVFTNIQAIVTYSSTYLRLSIMLFNSRSSKTRWLIFYLLHSNIPLTFREVSLRLPYMYLLQQQKPICQYWNIMLTQIRLL